MNAQEAARKTEDAKAVREQHRLLERVPKQIADAEKEIEWAVERGYTRTTDMGHLFPEAQRYFEDKGYFVTETTIYWDHISGAPARPSFFDRLFGRNK
jgi:hypothetical protein